MCRVPVVISVNCDVYVQEYQNMFENLSTRPVL